MRILHSRFISVVELLVRFLNNATLVGADCIRQGTCNAPLRTVRLYRYFADALLLCLITCQLAAVARETLKYQDSYIPPAAAIAQSNAFALGFEMSAPLLDGWQHQGFKTIIDNNGQFGKTLSSSLVVDRTNDPVLIKIIAEAQQRFGHLSAPCKAEALTRYAHSIFVAPGVLDDDLSNWDDSFGNQHRGERLLLGEYILQGKGVCEQQAVLLKVLADELHLPATLVFGFDNETGHVWTTMDLEGKELIYDPTQELIATTRGEAPSHKTIRDLYGADIDKLKAVIKVHDCLLNQQYPEAEQLLRQLVALDARALGKTHPVYAVSLGRIAALYELQDKGREAEPYLKEALSVSRHAWGPNHQEVADRLNKLANLEHSLGKNRISAQLFKRAIRIYEQALGPDDASIADPLYNLADLYKEQGRYAQAEELFKRALAIYQRAKGPDNEDVLDTLAKLKELSGSG